MKSPLLRFIPAVFMIQMATALGQTYRPFPTGQASWTVARCWSFYPSGWYDEYTFDQPGTDTIINNTTYRKIYMTVHHAPGTAFDTTYTLFMGGIRETNKQIFMVGDYICLDTIARLVYDFNPSNTGDTVFTHVFTNGLAPLYPKILTLQDSVLIGNQYHRRMYLADTSGFGGDVWVEGIGSMAGLIYANYYIITDNTYDLTCYYSEDLLKYVNPSPSYGFCTPPLPNIVCDSNLTTVPLAYPLRKLFSFPNPLTENILKIIIPENGLPLSYTIRDITGRVLFNSVKIFLPETIEIDFAEFSSGMYQVIFSEGQFQPVEVIRVK